MVEDFEERTSANTILLFQHVLKINSDILHSFFFLT